MFIKNNSRIIERPEIISVLDSTEEDDSAIELYVAYLRNKLRQIHADLTIEDHGAGYILSTSAKLGSDQQKYRE